MKKLNKFFNQTLPLLLTFNFALSTCFAVFSQSGAAINTTGAAADGSAILDVSSTTQGILIPRMTEAQKQAIPLPIATGLMIYQTDGTSGFWYYNGSAWVQSIGVVGAVGATGVTGVTGSTGQDGVAGLLTPGTAAGNTPYWDGVQWVVSSSNIFNNGGSVGIGTNNPDVTAALEISSTTKGTLITRMSTAERNAISNPALGLQIFNTTTKCIELFADGLWIKVNCAYKFYCGYDYVTFNYNGNSVTYGTVTGQNNTCWLDRNLGASEVATSYNQSSGYGDLFQWGRLNDGHQNRNSSSTTLLSSSDIPGHSNFIRNSPSLKYDWREPQNNNLWKGVSSLNNICPEGWRLPIDIELENERLSWNQNDNIGAFNSSLKLTAAGNRGWSNGTISNAGTVGAYWSSSTNNVHAYGLVFDASSAVTGTRARANGSSVRCIKDY